MFFESYCKKTEDLRCFSWVSRSLTSGPLAQEQRFISAFGKGGWSGAPMRATAELWLALCWAGTEMDLLTIVSAAYPLSQNGVLENALILNSRSLNAFSSICDTCLHSKGCGIPFLQWGQARFASDLPMGWQNASPNCCPSTCQLIFLSLRHNEIICHPLIN